MTKTLPCTYKQIWTHWINVLLEQNPPEQPHVRNVHKIDKRRDGTALCSFSNISFVTAEGTPSSRILHLSKQQAHEVSGSLIRPAGMEPTQLAGTVTAAWDGSCCGFKCASPTGWWWARRRRRKRKTIKGDDRNSSYRDCSRRAVRWVKGHRRLYCTCTYSTARMVWLAAGTERLPVRGGQNRQRSQQPAEKEVKMSHKIVLKK